MQFQVVLTWISSNFTDIRMCYYWETTGYLKVIAFKAKYWMTYCYTFSVVLSPELNISYLHTSMGFLLALQAIPPIYGSFYWSCCRTKTPAPGTSSGCRERKEFSSWLTPKLYPDCGGNTRTSLIWIMRLWAEPSGEFPQNTAKK